MTTLAVRLTAYLKPQTAAGFMYHPSYTQFAMPISSLPHFFFFSLLLAITSVSSQCLKDQKALLLHLKSEWKFDSSYSRALVHWNETDDCCGWDGVACDDSGHVISLDLSGQSISGEIHNSSSLFGLRYLEVLDLGSNSLSGNIPSSFFHLQSLKSLSLSNNLFNGTFQLENILNLPILIHLYLSQNQLSVEVTNTNSSSYRLPNLEELGLASCNLSVFPDFIQQSLSLKKLDLSDNRIAGAIPSWIWKIELFELYLSGNLFVELQKPYQFPISLDRLDLHSNQLKGELPPFPQRASYVDYSNNNFDTILPTTNISSYMHSSSVAKNSLSGEVPTSLCNAPNLVVLDLSFNNLRGNIPLCLLENMEFLQVLKMRGNNINGSIPDQQLPGSLRVLDLSNNNLGGKIPKSIANCNASMVFLSLANNSLSGEVPTSLCSATILQFLDLSFNNLRGNIPLCLLENMEFLQVLKMRGNNINGGIPDQLPTSLRTLDLSNNNLDGKIPRSIANCSYLVVLNVGYNNFVDTFPCMLPSSLHVLVLRFNRFYGELRCDKSWPNLQIVDISFNNFSGSLHPLNFSSWSGMMLKHLRPHHPDNNFLQSAGGFYWDEVTLAMKGLELKVVKIWPDFTCIDFSFNNFQGEIPDAIANLSSLYLLNLSHNALTGTIPRSLGILMQLESLDVSVNRLRGRIPEELARLTFLSFLNLSHNELVGMIPNGRQFQTFSADSFEGNKELCGFPLNKSCSSPPAGTGITPLKSKDEEIEWEYVFAALGYVVGLGSIAWTLLCCRSFRERYFGKIEEVVDKIFYQRARRRRHERRRRRRVERRNEVRRQQQS